MTEFESAVIIVLILLVLFSLWTMYSGRSWSCSPDKLSGSEWFAGPYDAPQVPLDQELHLLANNGYQELLNTKAVDSASRANHNEFVADSLHRTSGASKATVLDHDLDTNWRGLKRPRNITPSDDALQQYSANDSDFTKGTNLRW
jgi:hypothetical protein